LLGLPVLSGVTGCTEYHYTTEVQKDVFQQSRRNTVDVLMVVDNSGSMAEEQAKLAANFQSFIQFFQDVESDYRIGVITTDMYDEGHQGRLRGADDEIVLLNAQGVTIDRVAYDKDWGMVEGVAMQLDPGVTTASGNDDPEAWCAAVEAYGETDLGTPGAANAACARSRPAPHPDTGDTSKPEDTGKPKDTGEPKEEPEDTGDPPDDGGPESAGDVLITEFMADPADVEDALGEWIEITNTTDEDLSLAGCTLADDDMNSVAFPDSAVLPAGGRLVLARSSEGGVTADVELGADFTLNNNLLLIEADTKGQDEIFAENVAVGTTGYGWEMGMETAYRALSEPLFSEYNQSFLREEASFSMVFLSDEEDSSPYSVNDYLRFFIGLKGEEAFRDHGLMNISAVVGDKPPEFEGDPSCSSEHGDATYGSRFVRAAEYTEGALESICEEDFSPIAAKLGLTASGLELEFALSEACDENSLVVSLYETDDNDSFKGELTKDEDYSYVVERNAIRFEEEQVPPAQYYIVAEYKVLATGATP